MRVLVALLMLLGACARPAPYNAKAHRMEISIGNAKRIEKLTSETGFLTLAGLFWLEHGDNSVGSAAGNAVRLPKKAPAHLGVINRAADDSLTFQAEDEQSVMVRGGKMTSLPLVHDNAADEKTVLETGTVRFHVIARNDRLGVRVKDTQHPERLGFKGIEHFPVKKEWLVRGVFEAYEPPRSIKVPNVLGGTFDMASPGEVVFRKNGESYRLQAVGGPSDESLWLIFGDATNGKETYGGGRFLTIQRAGNFVTIDFNKSRNPPCAFTPYATCPLPNERNKLKLPITAGEKAYHYKKRHG
jgi:uncharacterized protein (DUF1684 family)